MFDRAYLIYGGDPSEAIAERAKTPIGRYRNFFDRVPLWSGEEWRTMEPEAIADFFKNEAFVEILQMYQQLRDAAAAEHAKLNWMARWWKEFWGWKNPGVPTLAEVQEETAASCLQLAQWMEQNQHRPFYEGSDLSCFIWKPRQVAKMLSVTIH